MKEKSGETDLVHVSLGAIRHKTRMDVPFFESVSVSLFGLILCLGWCELV